MMPVNKLLAYFYPVNKTDSFTYVARNHIEQLRRYNIRIFEAGEELIDNMQWVTKYNIVLHPYLLFLVGHSYVTYIHKRHRLAKIEKYKEHLIAFDVTDTDRISNIAVEFLNHADMIFVPSTFCKETMLESGVESDVYILPHGINNEFLRINEEGADTSSSPVYQTLDMIKSKRDYKFVLFFLLHSGYRKGADVVYKAMKKIQSERDDIILVVKRKKLVDPYMRYLRTLRMIEIDKWLNDFDLKALYDICDITIVPTRGGGFELNALESIATGTPTIVTDYGCFKDYINYTIPLRYNGLVRIFNNNIVHVGNGADPDPDDLANKIIDVIDNQEYYNELFREYASEIRKTYTWQNTGDKLYAILKKIL